MEHDREWNTSWTVSRCLLCEDTGRPPVAVFRRCGALVCEDHAVRLIHYPSPTPVGLMVPRSRRSTRRLEMVCETCYLNGLADGEWTA